ncbi:hypothetical protein ACRBDO_07255 [Helicobacter pylori]
MEKTETTIFVDWQNLLSDLKAIQETDERFKEPHFNFNNPESRARKTKNLRSIKRRIPKIMRKR